MSQQMKWELKLGLMTIIISLVGSMLWTTWYAASLASQIEDNQRAIMKIDHRITELTREVIRLHK
jgi:hypothetical protein